MIANNAHLGQHRDQDAAIFAVAHVSATSARDHSVGVHTQIDAVRAFLSIRWVGGADMRGNYLDLTWATRTI